MENLGYKKWLLQTGKNPEGIVSLISKQLFQRNKLAWALMKESGATFNESGVQTATEFLLKQLKQHNHGKKTESPKN